MAGFSEYSNYDGLGLAELVKTSQVAPLELVEEAISRIEATNSTLNAVVHKMYETARQTAISGLPDGPFKGVPFLVKDLLAMVAGAPYTCGTKALKNFVPDFDSELVRRYKAAGLLIIGKTNTPEFGLVPFTESELFGAAHNPWDTSRTTGGSSGGSGAAVAARYVPIAHGGDGGGSIRIPASCCGVFGLKPTRARMPVGPRMVLGWQGAVVEHVLSLSVRDSAAMLDATAGMDADNFKTLADAAQPYLQEVATPPGKLRIAFTTTPFMGKEVHPDCIAGVKQTVKLLEELGHEVVEAAPEINGQELGYAFMNILAGETASDLEDIANLTGKKLRQDEFEPGTWALYMLGKSVSAEKFVTSLRITQAATHQVLQFFKHFDVLLTPTLSEPPFTIGTRQPSTAELTFLKGLGRMRAGWVLNALNLVEQIAGKSFEFIPYTPVFNITGQPAMSVPLYWNAEGLPVGMHFVGRLGDEATLFRLAGQLEQAQPWAAKKPPVIAD